MSFAFIRNIIAFNFDIFDFELTAPEMDAIRKIDAGKRFFTMTLEEQEKNLGAWKPED